MNRSSKRETNEDLITDKNTPGGKENKSLIRFEQENEIRQSRELSNRNQDRQQEDQRQEEQPEEQPKYQIRRGGDYLAQEEESLEVKVNNYMSEEQEQLRKTPKEEQSKKIVGLSQNEDEEDFLKANSSHFDTEKENERNIKQYKLEYFDKNNRQANKEEESKYISQNQEELINKPYDLDSEKNAFNNQSKSFNNQEANSKFSNKNSFTENDSSHFQEMNSNHLKNYEEEMENENNKMREMEDEDDEDDEMGLIAEPEAVDVSVCTENLEEFDYEESPQEIMDSDEED